MIGNLMRFFIQNKLLQVAGRTALGARTVIITRWFWMAYFGALIVAIGLALLALTGYLQNEPFLATVVLILAGIALGFWFLLRKVRRFVERKAGELYNRVGDNLLGRRPNL